jgi:hypothetical protein
MVFDATDTLPSTVLIDDPASDERIFWNGVPFDGTTPTSKPEDL